MILAYMTKKKKMSASSLMALALRELAMREEFGVDSKALNKRIERKLAKIDLGEEPDEED